MGGQFAGSQESFSFPRRPGFCWYFRVKFSALLLAVCALAFVACNNLVTRRELYSPGKAKGHYTQQLRSGQYALGVQPQPQAVQTPAPDILAQ